MDFIDLATQCAPNVAPQTMAAVVSVESSHNPYAIGVVNGRLVRQPTTLQEAVATAKQLERSGKNFSVGIAQVNRYNLPKYGLTYEQAFNACQNVRVGGLILGECYGRAVAQNMQPQPALRAALSCYYSGNFTRGFKPDPGHRLSYVQKVVAAASGPRPQVQVPALDVTGWTAGEAPASAPARPFRAVGGSVMVVKDSVAVVEESEPEAPALPADESLSASMPAVALPPDPAPVPASRPTERKSALVF